VIVLLNYVGPVATLMILCAIVLENVILAEQMLVVVQGGLAVNVESGIVWIVRKATKIIVKNVDQNQSLNPMKKIKLFKGIKRFHY
jgi:hypothetical protein